MLDIVVADFCLRLAWGLIAALLLVPAAQAQPRFFRVQYLASLGLLTTAGFFLVLHRGWTDVLTLGIVLSLACCFAGSVVWHLEGAPLARLLVYPAVLSLTWVLFAVSHETGMLAEAVRRPGMLEAAYREQAPWYVVGAFTSAALLGSCTSAMLMGHSYLLAPTMSLKPLMRLFAAGSAALAVRVTLAGAGLLMVFARPDRLGGLGFDVQDIVMLTARWLLGLFGVLALGWMAWESARLRSTQSATGILYVVVVFCFIGELLSQVLMAKRGMIL